MGDGKIFFNRFLTGSGKWEVRGPVSEVRCRRS